MGFELKETEMAGKKRTYPMELAQRTSDGIEVTLAARRQGALGDVLDARTGVPFDVSAPADNALDVYYHPFAHAPVVQPEPLAGVEEPRPGRQAPPDRLVSRTPGPSSLGANRFRARPSAQSV